MKNSITLFLIFFFSITINSQNCITGDCNNGYGIIKLPENTIRHGFFNNGGVGAGIDIKYRTNEDVEYLFYEKNNDITSTAFGLVYLKNLDVKLLINHKTKYGLYFTPDKSKIIKIFLVDGIFKSVGFLEATGNVVGCMAGDCENGFGVYNFPTGGSYTGEFKNSNKSGIGYEKYSSGQEYHGEYVNNNRTGFGIYDWAPNSNNKVNKYLWQWNANKMQGKGVYYFGKNQFDAGNYKNDKLVERITSSDNK